MVLNTQDWFTEECVEGGTAFSFKLNAEKLHEETTPFQTIEIYSTQSFGHLMTIDGFVMLTARDNFLYHEMMVHPVMYMHSNPENVLIIGGGDCGTLSEVLKHRGVKLATQIEIDERVTRLSEQYFPELCESNQDPRAMFHFCDGIDWVKKADANSIDIIIVDSTDPLGPAEGLFSQSFYQQCQRILKNNGFLIHQSESPLYHLNLMQAMAAAMIAGGFAKTQVINFPQVCYPSGWWSATIASKDASIDLKQFRREDSHNKDFETKYYNTEIHQASLAVPEFMLKKTGTV